MGTTQEATLSIDGMHCEHCVNRVREALSRIDGVSVQEIEIGSATVTYDPSVVSRPQLAAALDDAGYELTS